jgi:transcriptional regulator with XRE-family HTH domain
MMAEQDTTVDSKKVIGKRLLDAREGLGLRKVKVAEFVGVSPQAVAQWETGDNSPTGKNLESVCRLFKVRPEYILFGITPGEQPNRLMDNDVVVAKFKETLDEMFESGAELNWIECKKKSRVEDLIALAAVNFKRKLMED